jgi:hypothetical protein
MSQPQDASSQRSRAEQRLELMARQLERVGLVDLRRVVTEGGPPGRSALRREAEMAVGRADLEDLLIDARTRFQDWLERAYNRGGYDPTPIALNWGRSLGSAADRVDVFRSVDDAVLATVAHELIAEDDRHALFEPYARMLALRPERRARHRP